MRAVSDAGPIIHLSWVDRLDLLIDLFDEILVPSGVRDEVLRGGDEAPGVAALRKFFGAGTVVVQGVRDAGAVAHLRAELGMGEAESIVLSGESDADLVLLDDRRARAKARERGLVITGTVGILRVAAERGLVDDPALVLSELRHLGFWISSALIDTIKTHDGWAAG